MFLAFSPNLWGCPSSGGTNSTAWCRTCEPVSSKRNSYYDRVTTAISIQGICSPSMNRSISQSTRLATSHHASQLIMPRSIKTLTPGPRNRGTKSVWPAIISSHAYPGTNCRSRRHSSRRDHRSFMEYGLSLESETQKCVINCIKRGMVGAFSMTDTTPIIDKREALYS